MEVSGGKLGGLRFKRMVFNIYRRVQTDIMEIIFIFEVIIFSLDSFFFWVVSWKSGVIWVKM